MPFIGSAKRDHFFITRNTIRIRNGAQYNVRNGFSPIARGKLVPDGADGTILDVRLSLHTFAHIWWSILVGGFAIAFVLSFLQFAGVVHIDSTFTPLAVVLVAILVGSIFYPFYLLAFWFVRRVPAYLIANLEYILDAKEAFPAADTPSLWRGGDDDPR